MEQAVEWLLQDSVLGASPAEITWMLGNILGVWLSIITATLALGDQRRVSLGNMSPSQEDARAKIRRDRNGILVLGEMAATGEIIKAFIHFGHGVTGLVATLAPEPVRRQLTIAIALVTLWFLTSSLLLLLHTALVMKARYDYRHVRRNGKRATWSEATREAIKEVRADFGSGLRLLWNQGLGRRR